MAVLSLTSFLAAAEAAKEPGVKSSGQGHDSVLKTVKDAGKFGDAHHVEDLLEVVGKADDGDDLIRPLGLGEKLDQQSDAAAVDIGVGVKLQKELARPETAPLVVGFVEKRFRKDGDYPLISRIVTVSRCSMVISFCSISALLSPCFLS